ncbi:MlaE family ABC transporter permease [Dongia deserti]|uniref:MlaE family ABC transporter permease n=1 Tax=Dongia deserti TaxID=2268030 RepID=UPI000E65E953|nr:ABC transporter permease [Dongia deserti]
MTAIDTAAAPRRHSRLQTWLAWLGRKTRIHTRFFLMLMALTAGIVIECGRPSSWRRPVQREFWRVLHFALKGSLVPTCFIALVGGIGMVYQALYWLSVLGEEASIGNILVAVLVRELAPVLVGVILLGRAGAVTLTELGQLHAGRQVRALRMQGLDPLLFLVMPRGVAFALASYTLGIIFVLATLLFGFVAGSLLGIADMSIWSFLDNVLRATARSDFVLFPLKMLAIGLMVAATICMTALAAETHDRLGVLMARGFVRGILAVLLTSVLFSLMV